jgi:GMP reductase
MDKALNYSDVYLVPEYSELKSRSEADISVEFLGKRYDSCWLPANMKSVIDVNIAKWLSENNYFYIYHRFGDTLKFLDETIQYTPVENGMDCKVWKTISISVGVKDVDKKLIRDIVGIDENNIPKFYPRYVSHITIDIANGDSILVKEMIEYIRNACQYAGISCPKIIAGNVCTRQAVWRLKSWGADAVKVGIGGGAACSTKNQTGFHIPMFSCVKDCCDYTGIPIISDGGIRENGDIAKSLRAGATLTMIGQTLAACIDAPGEDVRKIDGYRGAGTSNGFETIYGEITHKKYYGSASAKNKGENKHVEGFEINLPCNGLTYEQKYQEIKESLQSAVSYSGGKDLNSLKTVKWVTTK